MIDIKVYMYVIRGGFVAVDVLKSVWLGVAGFLAVASCGLAKMSQATDILIGKFIYNCYSMIYVFAWLGGLVARKKGTDQIVFAKIVNFQ